MATLQQVIEAVDAHIQSSDGLGINCIRGYPDFRRPDVSPPVAVLFYGGSNRGQEQPGRRIGVPRRAVTLTLAIYASSEVELFELAEALQEMRAYRPRTFTAGTGATQEDAWLYIQEDEREPPAADDPKELRHMLMCPVVVVYE